MKISLDPSIIVEIERKSEKIIDFIENLLLQNGRLSTHKEQ